MQVAMITCGMYWIISIVCYLSNHVNHLFITTQKIIMIKITFMNNMYVYTYVYVFPFLIY